MRKTVTATQVEVAEKLAGLSPEQQTTVIQAMDVLRTILGPWAGENPDSGKQ